MRIPRPEIVSEELAYHRRQVEVLAALLALSQKHYEDSRATKRVLQRKRAERFRAKAGCGCGREKPKVQPCGKRSTGSAR